MQTEHAYSSRHLVLSHFGTCISYNVETNFFGICLVSGLLSFEHPSVLLFCSSFCWSSDVRHWRTILTSLKLLKRYDNISPQGITVSFRSEFGGNIGRTYTSYSPSYAGNTNNPPSLLSHERQENLACLHNAIAVDVHGAFVIILK